MTLPLPLLVCEAGLHADGDPEYYLRMVREIRSWWTGWPRVAFKIQRWSGESTWTGAIQETTGRMPLKSISRFEAVEVHRACSYAGLLFGVTAHDTRVLDTLQADYIKLGSFDAARDGMLAAAKKTGLPVIASFPPGAGELIRTDIYPLECVSKYPANALWQGGGIGYSCHSTPATAYMHVLGAAEEGARIIEVHVTLRSPEERPLPGDMPVSHSMAQFRELAESLGNLWHA